jgi:hypothetical protein
MKSEGVSADVSVDNRQYRVGSDTVGRSVNSAIVLSLEPERLLSKRDHENHGQKRQQPRKSE